MTGRLILVNIQLVGNFVPGLEYFAQSCNVGRQIVGGNVKIRCGSQYLLLGLKTLRGELKNEFCKQYTPGILFSKEL